MADVLGISRRGKDKDNPQYLDLKKGIIPKVDISKPGWWRYAMVTGQAQDKIGENSTYYCTKWAFMLDAPFNISANCCRVMKKSPAHTYARKTGKHPMTAQMAEESRLRTSHWMKNGCNGFDMKTPISNPMSFWTEQDVLMYIKLNDIKIASVYGDIVAEEVGELAGQETWSTLGIFDTGLPILTTTGCKRTGCMFCGYGCHLEKSPNRFEMMKQTHPKQYEWIMKPWSEGGLGYRDVIDWINENGNLDIKY